MAHKIKNVKKIQKKSRTHIVTPLGNSKFDVLSGSSGDHHTVTLTGDGGFCTCPWSDWRPRDDGRSGCSHVVSAINHVHQQAGRHSVSAWGNEDDANRQHRPTFDIGDGVILTSRMGA